MLRTDDEDFDEDNYSQFPKTIQDVHKQFCAEEAAKTDAQIAAMKVELENRQQVSD